MKNYIYYLSLLFLVSCGPINNHQQKTNRNETTKKEKLIKTEKYIKFTPSEISSISYPNFDFLATYQYKDLTLLFGSYQSEPFPKDDYGNRLIVLDAEKKLIFRSRGAFDSRSFWPDFYKLNDYSPVFMVVEEGDEGGSWGLVIFAIVGQEVKQIGSVRFVIPKNQAFRDFQFDYIGDSTQIYKTDNKYKFDFQVDSVTNGQYGENVKIIKSKLHYIYDNTEYKKVCAP